MNVNLQCLNVGAGGLLICRTTCDRSIQIFGYLEVAHRAAQINSFPTSSASVRDEFGAFIG